MDGAGESLSADCRLSALHFVRRRRHLALCDSRHYRRHIWHIVSARCAWVWVEPGLGARLWTLLVVSWPSDALADLARCPDQLVLRAWSRALWLLGRACGLRVVSRSDLRGT